MKRIIFLFLVLVTLEACDPDVPGEKINLPEMTFNINVIPDTAMLRMGDTLKISSSISNKLGGISISNGEALIDFFLGIYDEIPITSIFGRTAINNSDFKIIIKKGKVNISNITSKITDIVAVPYADSIGLEFLLIPLKRGSYVIKLQSLFFEGSQGKTRTNPYFNIIKNNSEIIWKVPEYPASIPGDPMYKTLYYFAVTE